MGSNKGASEFWQYECVHPQGAHFSLSLVSSSGGPCFSQFGGLGAFSATLPI